jgi:dienelactone hydrolase
MKIVICLFLFAAFLVTPAHTDAASPVIENFKLDGERWTCIADGKPLSGLLFKPEGNGPFPVVVVSHAHGVDAQNAMQHKGREFVRWGCVCIATDYTHSKRELEAAGIPMRQRFCGKDAPTGERKWTPGKMRDFSQLGGAHAENIRRALACLEILRQQSCVDSTRIAAYGHSMGAFVTIALCAAAPDKIKAAAITAGGVHTQAIRASPTPDIAEKVRAPFLILHGTADKVVHPEESEQLKQILDKNKVPNERVLFEGVSHNLPNEKAAEVDRLTREWLTKYGVLRN